MCEPASLIITKEKVFFSLLSDSHEDIIRENSLHEGNAISTNILRIEILPPDGDMRKPLKEWIFVLDQDMMPEWFNKKEDEKRARSALVEWFNAKVLLEGHRDIKYGHLWVFNSATVRACDSATVRACDSATVTACDSATVTAYGSATVTACDSATVTAYGSATVTAYGSATVTAYGSATVTAYGSATVTACDSATVIKWSKDVKVSLSGKDEGRPVLIDRSGKKVAVRKVGK